MKVAQHFGRSISERLRTRIVLTPEEKSTLTFLLAAIVAGFATEDYRASHPRVEATPAIHAKPASHIPAKPRRARQSPTPEPEGDDTDS